MSTSSTSFAARRQQILDAVSSPAVDAALRELLVGAELAREQGARLRLADPAFILGVMGMQGLGKSLLINALAGRRIVPVGEAETTNVIVLLRASDGPDEHAEVRFRDGRVQRGPADVDFVSQFTDNELNPANERGVADVTCFLDAPLLRGGFALADTPGVGSLRPEIGQVTMDFLPRISVGLFVVPAVPTLRRSESVFLRATWRHSREFVFVQNRWGATARELADALDDNRRKLQEIATQEGDDRPIELVDVDFHEALEGLCNAEAGRVERSGLPALIAAVERRLAGGAEQAHLRTNGGAVARAVSMAGTAAESRRRSLAARGTESEAEFDARIASGRTDLARIAQEWQAAIVTFRAERDQLLAVFETSVTTRLAASEKRLTEHAEQRRIGASDVGRAIQDEIRDAVREPLATLERGFARAAQTLQTEAGRTEQAGERAGWAGSAAWTLPGELLEGVGGAMRWAGGLALTAFASSAAWAAGGALLAGETVAVAVAAAGAAVPGVGWVVAGAAVLAGLALAAAGRAQVVSGLRSKIAEAMPKARRNVIAGARTQVTQAAGAFEGKLAADVQATLDQAEGVLQDIERDRRRDAADRSAMDRVLESHLATLAAAAPAIADALRGGPLSLLTDNVHPAPTERS